MEHRQLGVIRIDDYLIRDKPDLIAEVFGAMKFVPVRAEAYFSGPYIEYMGISSFFVIVPSGYMPSQYDIRVTMSDDGHVNHVAVAPSTSGPVTKVEYDQDATKPSGQIWVMAEGNMDTSTMLHILRNPYGHSPDEIRRAALAAADEIEAWEKWGRDILAWAEAHGLDVTCYHG